MVELCHLAEKYCQPYEQLMAKGNLAIYKYYRGYTNEAIELLQEILDSSIEEDFKELIAYYCVQLAFFHLGIDVKISRKILQKAEEIIADEGSVGQLSKLTLFNYYHFFGVTLRRLGRHGEARKKYKKSAEYAEDDSKVARAFTNIGLSYQEEGKFKPAMNWYNKAMNKAQRHDNIKSAILNNIATLYLDNENVYMATLYIEKAMKMINRGIDPSRRIAIYDTYIDIHGNNPEKILTDIVALLKECSVFNANEHYLVSCLEKSLSHLIDNESIEDIQHLVSLVLKYSRIEGENRPLNDFMAVAVKGIHHLEDVDCFEIKGAFKKPATRS